MSEWDCPYVRTVVRQLREDHLIAGGGKGYYIPITPEEIHAGKMNQVRRIYSAIKTLRHYDQMAAGELMRFAGQLGLFDDLKEDDGED